MIAESRLRPCDGHRAALPAAFAEQPQTAGPPGSGTAGAAVRCPSRNSVNLGFQSSRRTIFVAKEIDAASRSGVVLLRSTARNDAPENRPQSEVPATRRQKPEHGAAKQTHDKKAQMSTWGFACRRSNRASVDSQLSLVLAYQCAGSSRTRHGPHRWRALARRPKPTAGWRPSRSRGRRGFHFPAEQAGACRNPRRSEEAIQQLRDMPRKCGAGEWQGRRDSGGDGEEAPESTSVRRGSQQCWLRRSRPDE